MVNSPYHQLAQWLVNAVEPVRSRLARHSLRDSFEFVSVNNDVNAANKKLSSFDVQSLFTNVPINEVINSIHEYAAEHKLQLRLPLFDLERLLRLCTTGVRFLFDGNYYIQSDGVAMGSPLRPVLADIFMGYVEQQA